MADCACGGAPRIVYSCSGASDVGELSDRVARLLRDSGKCRMSCLAAVGAGLSGYVQSAAAADINIIIDGCVVGCGRKIFENIEGPKRYFVLTEMGYVKGATPVSDKTAEEILGTIVSEGFDTQCC